MKHLPFMFECFFLAFGQMSKIFFFLEAAISVLSLFPFMWLCWCSLTFVSFIHYRSLSSVSDILPKVETRVVLVGEAGRNESLIQALQVYHSSVNPVVTTFQLFNIADVTVLIKKKKKTFSFLKYHLRCTNLVY